MPVERADSHAPFHSNKFIFLWKKNIVCMETSQPGKAGSPIEEARAPFMRAGILHVNANWADFSIFIVMLLTK